METAVSSFTYRTIATDSAARAGAITTAHGAVETPAFMPVGTAVSVASPPHCSAGPYRDALAA